MKSLSDLRNCPLCNNTDPQILYQKNDYLLTKANRVEFKHSLGVCTNCGFLYCTNTYSEDDLEDFYANQLPHFKGSSTFNLGKRLEQIDKIVDKVNTVLEVGANQKTDFHQALEKAGKHVTIYEPQEECSDSTDLNAIQELSQDVICMYHTLEHIQDPVKFLTEIKVIKWWIFYC